MSSSVKTDVCDKPNSGPRQEDYCVRSDKTMSEHQTPVASLGLGTGETQSSAKPKQQC